MQFNMKRCARRGSESCIIVGRKRDQRRFTMAMHILSVDFQNEFAAEGGAHYRPRPCVPFITDTFLPFVRGRGSTIAEIISDYRVTEPGSGTPACVPGLWGYQSLIPTAVKHPRVWVKAEPSPAWTRAGAGQAEQLPGAPYPAPDAFSAWLTATIGPPSPDQEIILVGLMLEICVLSTLQELYYRGYRAKVLFEGVDTYAGDVEHKRLLFATLFPFWGQAIFWHDLATAGP
jgi:nicotinamidase-related amidase